MKGGRTNSSWGGGKGGVEWRVPTVGVGGVARPSPTARRRSARIPLEKILRSWPASCAARIRTFSSRVTTRTRCQRGLQIGEARTVALWSSSRTTRRILRRSPGGYSVVFTSTLQLTQSRFPSLIDPTQPTNLSHRQRCLCLQRVVAGSSLRLAAAVPCV